MIIAAAVPGRPGPGPDATVGYFDDEREAALAVDTAARRLRGDAAHRGRPTVKLNAVYNGA
eukprot:COSAG06_NODE_1174_length_10412_cov_15.779405_1_plen_61_part_00